MAEILIQISGDVTNINKTLDDLTKSAESKGNAIGTGITAGLTASLATAGLQAINKLGSTLSGLFQKSIDEAAQAGVALNLFNTSLAASGNFSEQASLKFQNFAKSLQDTTGISDDAIISNASLLASLGRLSGEGLERATQAAIDLAATGRISLEGAFSAIEKAANGNTAALGRLGIKIDESIPQAERFGVALGQIESRLGGLAAAQINTFSGALGLLSTNFNDVLENFGKLITESPTVIGLVKQIGLAFGQFANSIAGLGGQDIVGNLIKQVLQLGQSITTYVIAPLELLFNVGNFVFKSMVTGLNVIGLAIASVIESVALLVSGFLDLASKVGTVVGVFNKEIGDGIKNGLGGLRDTLATNGVALRETFQENLVASANETGEAFATALDFPISNGLSNTLTKVQVMAEGVSQTVKTTVKNAQQEIQLSMQELVDQLPSTASVISAGYSSLFLDFSLKGKAAVDALAQRTNEFKNSVNGAFKTFATGFAQSFAQIGAALVKGQNLFAAFGKAILGVFGQLAVNTGTAIFLMGLGTYNPGQVAAGLALIALGGVLQALAGGGAEGGSGVGGSASGGGSIPAQSAVAGGTGATQTAFNPDQVGTQVNVNVAGNILNTRDSQLAIVESLQGFFDTNGNTIVGSRA